LSNSPAARAQASFCRVTVERHEYGRYAAWQRKVFSWFTKEEIPRHFAELTLCEARK
jgi:hypothetical protein